MAVINEPEVAVAAARCVTARALDQHGVTEQHPRPCTWCDYDRGELARMVQGYNTWAGYSERSGTYERHEARVFAELPRDEQLRRIVEAQGLEPESQPVEAEADALPTGEREGGSIPLDPRGAKDRPADAFLVGQVQTNASAPAGDAELDVDAWLS
jgi:hypothetical protein